MEDFVTYNQAVRLKELGFNWKVNHYYNSGKDLCENLDYDADIEKDDDTSYKCFNTHWVLGIICSAPTLSQAAKWLREVKEIIIVCTPEINKSDDNNHYIGEHYTGRWYCESDSVVKTYPTYEEALSAGINAAIKIIYENKRNTYQSTRRV